MSAAGALRRAVVAWFAVLAAVWTAVLVPAALHASSGVAAAATGATWLMGIVAGGHLGLRRTLGLVRRLTEERAMRTSLGDEAFDALRDGLTGLGNHRAFQEELDRQLAGPRNGRGFALLFLDLDDLGKTNDLRGHAAGDEVLRAAARIVHATIRRSDRAFRVGGDEFAIVLADCAPEHAVAIGHRILAGALNAGAGTLRVDPFSLTIGVSAFPSPAGDRQQLLHQADAALNWGKRHGRMEIQLFDAARHGAADVLRPLPELGAAVSRVARERLLTPVYQPIHCLRTGRVLGYEGLVRPLPDAGFPNPGALFVAAEAAHRTVELDLASLETVLSGASSLDPACYLSVNLSPRSLEADAFSPQELIALARRHAIDAARIVVELTERETVEDMARLRTALAFLRRHGVRIAADDVGAGNAGLRLLSELPFDVMKIDLSLVRAGARNDPSDAVLRALRELARRRGQTIVAEGVETAAELRVVRDLGFDAAQGYLLRRPAPGLDAPALDLDALAGELAETPLPAFGLRASA